MSDVFNNAFDVLGGKSHAPNINVNRPFRTRYGSLIGGTVNLDPSIRTLQNETLGNYRNLYSSALGNRTNFLNDVTGNRSAFIQARVDPLRASLGQGRSALRQGLQRRGVYGSFANQDLNNYDWQANRQLEDARAQALQDSLNAQLTGDTSYLSTLSGLNSGIGNIADQRTMQELQALGLSSDTINNLLRAQIGSAGLQDKAARYGADALGRILFGAGKAAGAPGLDKAAPALGFAAGA